MKVKFTHGLRKPLSASQTLSGTVVVTESQWQALPPAVSSWLALNVTLKPVTSNFKMGF